MPQTKIIKSKKLSWLNIVNASESEIFYLKKKFNFNEFDLEDSYAHKHAQRPKINVRPDYIFIVLLFPVYNRKDRSITPAEVDIYLTKDHLVTLHYNQLDNMRDFFNECENDKQLRDLYLGDPTNLLYEILERQYSALFPMLDHISLNINDIEKNIFAGKERQMVTEILVIKRNIVYFRKIMQAHKNVYKKIISLQTNFLNSQNRNHLFFADLIEQVKNIWDILENHQQTINALEDTNNALVTFKLNDIMRTLTIFSVIVFPLTLMAAIFGMNVETIPISGSDYDFWKILFLMLLASFGMYFYFKHKKWI